jgi:hypothetical protein
LIRGFLLKQRNSHTSRASDRSEHDMSVRECGLRLVAFLTYIHVPASPNNPLCTPFHMPAEMRVAPFPSKRVVGC